MSELENVRTEKVTLKIHGKEREIKFGFSAWAKLEDEYGGLKNIAKLQKAVEERPFNVIPHLLYIGLVDKEGVTEDNILDEYGLGEMDIVTDALNRAFSGSLPTEKKVAVEAMKQAN